MPLKHPLFYILSYGLEISVDGLETAASSGCQFCTFAPKISQHLPETVPRVKVQVDDSVVTGDSILSYSVRVGNTPRIDAADTPR